MIIDELVALLGFELRDTAAADKYEGRLKKIGDTAKRVGEELRAVGLGMTAMFTAPVLASVKAGADFERQLNQIIGLAGVAPEQVAQWREQLLAMSNDMGLSVNELTDALYFIASSGLDLSEAMNVLEASAKAGASGLGEINVIADAATSAMNAYGASNLSAEQAVSLLVAGVRVGKGEANEFAGTLGRVIPIASQMGISFDQVVASVAAMSTMGLDAAEGTTALRGIMTTLLKPTKQANDALEEYGLTVQQLRDMARDEGLLPVLQTLQETFGGDEEAMAAVFGNVRALAGALNLVGENLDNTKRIFSELSEETTGSLDDAFKAVSEDTLTQLNRNIQSVKNAFLEMAAALTPVVVPMLNEIAGAVRSATEWFSSLSPEMQHIIAMALGIAAALGPLLLGLGILIGAIGRVVSLFALLGKGASVAAGGFALMAGAILSIGWLIAGVVDQWDDLVAAFDKILSGDILQGVSDLLFNLGEGLVNVFESLTGIDLENLIHSIIDSFINLGPQLFQAGVNMIMSLWQGMLSVVNDMLAWVAGIGDQIVAGITGGASGLSSIPFNEYDAMLRNDMGPAAPGVFGVSSVGSGSYPPPEVNNDNTKNTTVTVTAPVTVNQTVNGPSAPGLAGSAVEAAIGKAATDAAARIEQEPASP